MHAVMSRRKRFLTTHLDLPLVDFPVIALEIRFSNLCYQTDTRLFHRG